MDKFKTMFNPEEGALLALGVYDRYSSLDDLEAACNEDGGLKEILDNVRELKGWLLDNITRDYFGEILDPSSSTPCPYSDERYYTRKQLRAFVEPMNVKGLVENIDRQVDIFSDKPIGVGEKKTLLQIIGALTHALADQGPKNLKREGAPIVGTDESGIIGFLKKNSYISFGKSTLHKHISNGLNSIEEFKKR